MAGAEGRRSDASEALFRPVRAANAFEETVERLLQAVRLGVVAPGERLPSERDLASRLGVGREKVREGLAALTEAGYLEVRRGRYGGTFVRSADPEPPPAAAQAAGRAAAPDAATLVDTLTFRHVVETGAAEAAAATDLSASERAHLRGLLDRTSSSPPGDYRRLDSRLHLAVAEVTRYSSLIAADA